MAGLHAARGAVRGVRGGHRRRGRALARPGRVSRCLPSPPDPRLGWAELRRMEVRARRAARRRRLRRLPPRLDRDAERRAGNGEGARGCRRRRADHDDRRARPAPRRSSACAGDDGGHSPSPLPRDPDGAGGGRGGVAGRALAGDRRAASPARAGTRPVCRGAAAASRRTRRFRPRPRQALSPCAGGLARSSRATWNRTTGSSAASSRCCRRRRHACTDRSASRACCHGGARAGRLPVQADPVHRPDRHRERDGHRAARRQPGARAEARPAARDRQPRRRERHRRRRSVRQGGARRLHDLRGVPLDHVVQSADPREAAVRPAARLRAGQRTSISSPRR